MALFTPGGVLGGGTISGAQGAVVYSRNRGGAYVRNRVVPINPNTIYQQQARARLSTYTSRWFNVLTAVQRAEWETYAANVPRVNRIGLPVNHTGLNWYVAMNSFRIQNGRTIVDDAPADFVMAPYTLPTSLIASEAAQTISMIFDPSETWADDEGCMGIYASRPQNVTKNYFRGPYRYADTIVGNTAVPPVSPYAAATAFPFTAGQAVFVRVNVCEATGLLGTSSFHRVVATA